MQKLNATLSCHAIRWIKPSQWLVKVNFDAGFDRHRKIGGVGIIARNVEGFVLATKAQQLDKVTNSFLAEANTAYMLSILQLTVVLEELLSKAMR
ncbi:hypothetical protein PTKIN_Ptkin09bG0240800 [Pterospermum kingtungense]